MLLKGETDERFDRNPFPEKSVPKNYLTIFRI